MLFIPKDLHVPGEDPSCQLRARAGPHAWWTPRHSYRPPAPSTRPPFPLPDCLL